MCVIKKALFCRVENHILLIKRLLKDKCSQTYVGNQSVNQ